MEGHESGGLEEGAKMDRRANAGGICLLDRQKWGCWKVSMKTQPAEQVDWWKTLFFFFSKAFSPIVCARGGSSRRK